MEVVGCKAQCCHPLIVTCPPIGDNRPGECLICPLALRRQWTSKSCCIQMCCPSIPLNAYRDTQQDTDSCRAATGLQINPNSRRWIRLTGRSLGIPPLMFRFGTQYCAENQSDSPLTTHPSVLEALALDVLPPRVRILGAPDLSPCQSSRTSSQLRCGTGPPETGVE